MLGSSVARVKLRGFYAHVPRIFLSWNAVKKVFRRWKEGIANFYGVHLPPSDLDKKLATFLRKRRGEMSFEKFSRLTGMPPSSLFRLEQCQQSLALKRLDRLLKRLKVSIVDVFGDGKK